jgi:hypothetical protein
MALCPCAFFLSFQDKVSTSHFFEPHCTEIQKAGISHFGSWTKSVFYWFDPSCCGGFIVYVHIYRDVQFQMFLVDAGGIHVDPLLSVAQIALGRFCSFLRTVLFWLS